MKHSENITKLINKVDEAAPTTEDQYPALKELSYPLDITFTVGHSARHLSMSSGKLNKIVHDAEHGGKLEIAEVKNQIFSAMFTLCKLCKLTGMNGDDLVNGTEALADKYKAEFS